MLLAACSGTNLGENANETSASGNIATPAITSLSPSSATAGGPQFTIVVRGVNFAAGDMVSWNGNNVATTFVTPAKLTVVIPGANIASPDTVSVAIISSSGGGTSNAITFTIASNATIADNAKSPVSVAVDPSGNFVYVADFGHADVSTGSVSMYRIDTNTGMLAPIGAPVSAEHGPSVVIVYPSGKFLYVVDYGDEDGGEDVGDVSAYSIDAATGVLAHIGTIRGVCPQLCAPTGMALDPSGKFAYVTSEGGPAPTTISLFSIDGMTGVLTSIGTLAAQGRADRVTVHPSGQFAYATVLPTSVTTPSENSSVSIYALDTTQRILKSRWSDRCESGFRFPCRTS